MTQPAKPRPRRWLLNLAFAAAVLLAAGGLWLALGRAEVGLETARVFRALEGGYETEDLLASGRALDLAESGSPFSDSVATALAQILEELGSLPEEERARRAVRGVAARRRLGLFGMRREAR